MSGLLLQLACQGSDGFRLQLDCQVPSRGVTAVYGPSGSGKTTLLECIAGLRRADPGSVLQFEHEIWQQDATFLPPWQRQIGFVFQDARLFPQLSVEQNLAYARARSGGRKGPRQEQVVTWLDLQPLLQRLPATLSAGQRQRVAIGRALSSAPRLLLLDEPLANLDTAARRQCLQYLQRLRDSLALPMLYVSHDIEEVGQLAEHMLLLDNGKLEAQGSLLNLCSQLDTRLAHEEQAAAIVSGQVRRHDREYGLTELELEGQTLWVNHLPEAIGQQRRIRIPARDVSLCRARPADSSILNILPVQLAEVETTGDARVLLRLALGQQFLLARITRKSLIELQLAVGDTLFAQIKSAALMSEATDEL